MTIRWNDLLLDQLTWHWDNHLRPGLDGLTDAEYVWEPAPGAWSVRPRGESTAPMQAGTGEMVVEFAYPEPDPAPVTTIAWRLAHVIVGIYGARVGGHFGGPAVDYPTWAYAASADEALAQLDAGHRAWVDGVRGLGEDGLLAPCGPAEGDWAQAPMAALVVHISREVIHHGAEMLLLRDLYRSRPTPA